MLLSSFFIWGSLLDDTREDKTQSCVVDENFIKYYFLLLFLICFLTPVFITISLNLFISLAVRNCAPLLLSPLTSLVAGTRSTSPSRTTSGSPWPPACSCGGPPSSSSCWKRPLFSSFRSLSQCSSFCWATCITFWGKQSMKQILLLLMCLAADKLMMSGQFCTWCLLTTTSSVQKGKGRINWRGWELQQPVHRGNPTIKHLIMITFRLLKYPEIQSVKNEHI